MKTRSIVIALAAMLFVAVQAPGQGIYWEQKVTVSMGGTTHESASKGYMKPMKVKTISEEDGHGAIVRADKEIMYSLNLKDKTYSEMTFKELEAQMGKMNEEMKKLQEQMKEMPPEQRKAMEGMMGGMMGEKDYQLKKTGEKRKIAGYACEKVAAMDGGKEAAEFWITKDISMKEYKDAWSKLMERAGKTSFMKVFQKLGEMDGFVMAMKFMGMASETTKLEKRAIGDNEFEIPAGYKKVKAEILGED